MSYENAPATKMLATHCAICRRPLLDAKSVEVGIGPDCRERHGYNIDVDESARAQANEVVYRIALGAGAVEIKAGAAALALLGFTKLAEVVIDRNTRVRIESAGADLKLHTPFNPVFTEAMKEAARAAGCRPRWEKESKCWVLSAAEPVRRALWETLKAHYRDTLASGPAGAFVIG